MYHTSTHPPLLHRLGRALLDGLAPHLCPLCGAAVVYDQGACGECLDSLPPAPFPNDLTSRIAARSARSIAGLERIAARWSFTLDSPAQELIHAMKYRGLRVLARQMGGMLGVMLREFPEFARATVIVPVPLHPARLRERGYNQALEIARGVASTLHGATVHDILRRTRYTGTQTRLGAEARTINVTGAFAPGESLDREGTLLLCDDVCTTGSTLGACAAALRRAGAASVVAATLCHDESEAGR